MRLNSIGRPKGARTRKKIVGRGTSSGHGKTSCRGHKGQTARSGRKLRPGFEGGQMPLIRRIPKRGFNNKFKKEFQIINIGSLNIFDDGQEVKAKDLVAKRLIKTETIAVKVLGDGELKKKLVVYADKFSLQAAEKIKGLGGKAELINA